MYVFCFFEWNKLTHIVEIDKGFAHEVDEWIALWCAQVQGHIDGIASHFEMKLIEIHGGIVHHIHIGNYTEFHLDIVNAFG